MRNGLVLDPNLAGKVLCPCFRRYAELFCAAGIFERDRMRRCYPAPIGQTRGQGDVAGFRSLGVVVFGVGLFRKIVPVYDVELHDGVDRNGAVVLSGQLSLGDYTDDAGTAEREMGVRGIVVA